MTQVETHKNNNKVKNVKKYKFCKYCWENKQLRRWICDECAEEKHKWDDIYYKLKPKNG